MQYQWTDGEGDGWLVSADNSGAAKATGGPECSDAGTSMISFPSLDGSGIYVVETGDLRDPSDIPDEGLQELLDWARELRG